jgi:hypothetical protein
MILSKTYSLTRKPSNTSPGLIFVRKHVLMSLYMGGLIYRGGGGGGEGRHLMFLIIFIVLVNYTACEQ